MINTMNIAEIASLLGLPASAACAIRSFSANKVQKLPCRKLGLKPVIGRHTCNCSAGGYKIDIFHFVKTVRV